MSARELTESYPSFSIDGVSHAAVLPAGHQRPALPAVDRDGQPYAVMSGSPLIGRPLPEYSLEDPLAAVIDDQDLDEVSVEVSRLTVADWLPHRRLRRPTAGPDTSVMHITALTSCTHTPPVAVVERDGDRTRLAGAVPATRLTQPLVGGT
ncbi:hypothetical protein [Streptomyces sp. 351MFTsu5.1]|uniref:hypothetical protein n=1 Tax=Streptomyces sp. 351MFTsu5.1 TaxID=1172180 RepID=UPI0003672B83|nr:hypothetical protein [Streptomyces sp. 351MFTsu5.1]